MPLQQTNVLWFAKSKSQTQTQTQTKLTCGRQLWVVASEKSVEMLTADAANGPSYKTMDHGQWQGTARRREGQGREGRREGGS